LTYQQLLLELWLAGARIYPEDGGRIRVDAPLTDELRAAIRRYKRELLQLARIAESRDGRMTVPARDYITMFWTPRPAWRHPA